MLSIEDVRCIKLPLLQYDPRIENLQAVAAEQSIILSQEMLCAYNQIDDVKNGDKSFIGWLVFSVAYLQSNTDKVYYNNICLHATHRNSEISLDYFQ